MTKVQKLLAELNEVWHYAGTFLYDENSDIITVTLSTQKKIISDNSKGAGDILTRALVMANSYSIYTIGNHTCVELLFKR